MVARTISVVPATGSQACRGVQCWCFVYASVTVLPPFSQIAVLLNHAGLRHFGWALRKYRERGTWQRNGPTSAPAASWNRRSARANLLGSSRSPDPTRPSGISTNQRPPRSDNLTCLSVFAQMRRYCRGSSTNLPPPGPPATLQSQQLSMIEVAMRARPQFPCLLTGIAPSRHLETLF